MYDAGFIKQAENGQYVGVEDAEEREQIRSKSKQHQQMNAQSQQLEPGQRPEFDSNILDDMDQVDPMQ